MADPLEELCRAYLNDQLSAGERIRFESRLSSGDGALLDALERVKGNFPKESVLREPKQPRQSEPGERPMRSVPPPVSSQPPPEPLFPEPEKPAERLIDVTSGDKVRQTITRAAAVLALLLIIYSSWLQWELIVTRQKLERASNRKTAEPEMAPVEDRTFINAFELDRLKAALTADQGKLLHIAADKKSPFKKAFLMVDFSTNRTLAMIRCDSLPPGMKLAFWVENRDYDVNLLGTITRIRLDSVYTAFEGSAFVHSRFLEVHLQKDDQFRSSNKIARIKLP